MMNATVVTRVFTFYHVGAQIDVSIFHLQFADDTWLVVVKSWANVIALKAILILFEAISGLKVNFHKSMLAGVDVVDS